MTESVPVTTKRFFVIAAYMYGFTILALFFYSFTQVDLNLTLSRITLVTGFQNYFQYTGYWQRPLSTALYSSILIILHGTYIVLIIGAYKNAFSFKFLRNFIIGITIILLFSYPAFSYDIFNYLFDGRIVTKYAQNPYFHKALDYQNDPWINFMRWTHRVYPYGPFWLVLTVPLSYIGGGYFVWTLLLFKSLMAGAYIVSVRFISQLLKPIHPDKRQLGIVFFALNPLVIIESLVSGHNDIVMMALVLGSLALLFSHQKIQSVIVFVLSVGIKFATAFLLPVYGYYWIRIGKHKTGMTDWSIGGMVGIMIIAILAATMRTQFQPWYLLYIFPFMALLSRYKSVIIAGIVLSITGLSLYVPYIFTGNWNPPIPDVLNIIIISGVAAASSVVLYEFAFHNLNNRT